MRNNAQSMFNLSIILITLAGFCLLISTVYFTQEKYFAFKGVEESNQNIVAREYNQSEFTTTFDGNSLSDQSYIYNKQKVHYQIIGLVLINLSLICHLIGSKVKVRKKKVTNG